MSRFTREEKIEEIDRELRQRKNVYRKLVYRHMQTGGTDGISQETADRQIAILREIRDDIEKEGRLL